MNKKNLPRRALTLWQLRAAVISFLACFLIALCLSDISFLCNWLLAGAGVVFLFFLSVYYPLKYLKFCYFIYDGQLIVDTGVFYNRRKTILLENIQYVSTLQTPDMLPFRLCSVMIHSVGSSLYLPCLNKEDARYLQEYCVRRKKHPSF